jgi:hypothetical protein
LPEAAESARAPSAPVGFDGFEVITVKAVIPARSAAVVAIFTVVFITVPTVAYSVVLVGVNVAAVMGPALDGATESIPKPNAATATSEIRLKVVFVDICFLSFSREQEFPALGFG